MTALLAIVAAKDPVPEPVTSPVKVIVWSPVFVPDTLALLVTVSVLPSLMVRVEPVAGGVIVTLFIVVALTVPLTSNLATGEVEPIPTLPAENTVFPEEGLNVWFPVQVGDIVTDSAGAASDLIAVVADPLTAVSPTLAVGLLKPLKEPGKSEACIAEETKLVPLPRR